MKLSISITPRAEQDFLNIWRYTRAHWGEPQADIYLEQLNSGIALLSGNPLVGADYSHARTGYRKFRIEKHHVFYIPRASELVIVRILHISMDADNWL